MVSPDPTPTPDPVPDPTPTPGATAYRVRTVPAHDELHHDGESLVLLDGQVRRVSPLGTVIREHAVDGATVAELGALLEETFGAPEDGSAEELTRGAVDTLLEAGLLARCEP